MGKRDGKYNTTETINHKSARPLIEPIKVTERWRKFLNESLNSTGGRQNRVIEDKNEITLEPDVQTRQNEDCQAVT